MKFNLIPAAVVWMLLEWQCIVLSLLCLLPPWAPILCGMWHDPPIPRHNYCNIMYPPYTDMRPLSSNIALQFKVILCFKCWKCWLLEQMEHVVNCMSCSCSVQPLHVTNLAVDVKNILKHTKNIL